MRSGTGRKSREAVGWGTNCDPGARCRTQVDFRDGLMRSPALPVNEMSWTTARSAGLQPTRDVEQSSEGDFVCVGWQWKRGGDVVVTTDMVRCGSDYPTRSPALGLIRGEVLLQGFNGLGAGQDNGGCRKRRCVEGALRCG